MTVSPTETTALYLDVEAAEGASEHLAAALAICPVAAVLVRASPARHHLVGALCAAAQAAGAAALVFADPALALRNKADGVHLPWSDDAETAFAEARRLLGRDRIVGAEAGASRHDAMVLGETGADYVAFAPTASSPDTLEDLVGWWAEIFEVPSVAMGQTDPQAALQLAALGADFIGWRLIPGQTAAEQIARLRALADDLRRDGFRASDTAGTSRVRPAR